MARLTAYVKTNNLLVPLVEVMLVELEKNLANKVAVRDCLQRAKQGEPTRYRNLKKEYGLTIDECLDVIKAMEKERATCQQIAARGDADLLAIRDADNVLQGVYGRDKKVLDLVALITPVDRPLSCWMLGDCKFEIKTDARNLFADAANFQERVAQKFESVQGAFEADSECHVGPRLIIVCQSTQRNAKREFENLKLGKETQPPIVKGNYAIVSARDVVKVLSKETHHFDIHPVFATP